MSVLRDMSFADYLAHPAYGSSDLRAFRSGPPAVVPWRRANRSDEGTDATNLGRAAHCAILTPKLFAAEFQVKPEGLAFRSKEAKALRDGWLAEGRTILSQEQWAQIQGVVKAFHGKRAADAALRRASAIEASVFWTCDKTGLPCKSRPDFWIDGEAVYDLKVSIDAEKGLDTLAYKAYANGWGHQLAGNREALAANGINTPAGRLIVIAPSPPQEFRVWLLELCENDLDFLALDNRNTRFEMAECHRTGQWPGTPDDWKVIELPASAAFTESDLEGATNVLTES